MEPGDLTRFYKPILPCNRWHFLIRLSKPKESRTSKPTEGAPSERNDDKGGDGKEGYKPPQGGSVGRSDGGGGKSDGGSSNEKKSRGVGHCCMA
ncbi:hypothetical protein Acr_28g0007990 [Actinidia rufa]|uniref:Uncharacterized protein n=1 Tax=Actinidia rufa TaxID=165716 RepID=A0A7J0HBF2_9ERIC|nr:hypothetical protein Acr_28g0007990 [Actinidia rufa]